jgi:hypothetical protein
VDGLLQGLCAEGGGEGADGRLVVQDVVFARWGPRKQLFGQCPHTRVMGKGMTVRPELHTRFLAVVARGIERADREEREDLARVRALPDLPDEDGGAAKRRRASAQRGNLKRALPISLSKKRS